MRERWLLQGMGAEEEEARRKQLEKDEEQGKMLENMIHRYGKNTLWFVLPIVTTGHSTKGKKRTRETVFPTKMQV